MSLQVAQTWLEAFQQKDISLLRLAENFVHISPFGEVVGRDDYLELVKANEEAFFSNPIQVEDFVGEGQRFVVRYVVGDMPATDWIYVSESEIERVISYYHFGDSPSLD